MEIPINKSKKIRKNLIVDPSLLRDVECSSIFLCFLTPFFPFIFSFDWVDQNIYYDELVSKMDKLNSKISNSTVIASIGAIGSVIGPAINNFIIRKEIKRRL